MIKYYRINDEYVEALNESSHYGRMELVMTNSSEEMQHILYLPASSMAQPLSDRQSQTSIHNASLNFIEQKLSDETSLLEGYHIKWLVYRT